MHDGSELIVDPATVNKTEHALIRVLRLLYTKLRITENRFKELHHAFFTTLNPTADQYMIGGDRSNEKKSVKDSRRLTWGKFKRATVDIPDLELMEMIYVYRDRSKNEIMPISTNDRINREGEYVPCRDYHGMFDEYKRKV